MALNESEPVVKLSGVTYRYSSGKVALEGIDLEIVDREVVAVVGPSGAGKSTLLRLLNGLLLPSSGSVTVLGRAITEMGTEERRLLRREIGMIFQDFALVNRLSVITNVLIGRLGYAPTLASILGHFSNEDRQIARSSIEKVGLAGFEEREVRKLSGGQRQRVGIARALAQGGKLLLGDEPTANLDVRTADETLGLLKGLSVSEKATLVLSLHDIRLARQHCTRIIALVDGRLVWDGPAGSFDEGLIDRVFYGRNEKVEFEP